MVNACDGGDAFRRLNPFRTAVNKAVKFQVVCSQNGTAILSLDLGCNLSVDFTSWAFKQVDAVTTLLVSL